MRLNDWQAAVWGLWRQGRNTNDIMRMAIDSGWSDKTPSDTEATVTRVIHRIMDRLYDGAKAP